MAKIIPSPKSLPLVGTLFSLLKEGGGAQLHKYVERRHQELGPIYKESIGPVEAYFVKNPNDMRQVFAAEGMYPVHVLPECWMKYNSLYGCNRGLYFMDGQDWMRTRKILNKYLLKSYSPDLQHCLTKDLLKQFENNIVSLGGVDVESHLYQLSISFVIAHMLGTPFISHYQSLTNDIRALSEVVHKIFEYSVALSMLPINLSVRLSLPAWTSFVQSVNSSLNLASVLCDKMERYNGDGLMSKLKQEGVTSEMIRRIVIDFILAAGDTESFF
uniref:Cytochrome P450 315a1, mitochondrial n=1 Tax=Cacopsylla melanoneura TaxID=428564 RepID=A0A8D9AZY4_9HEMI